MSYQPCKNPSCKSFGKPHPNCRCFDGMAAGGDVEGFCAADKSHHADCEYYADGGDVSPEETVNQIDPALAAAGYLAHDGVHGILKMSSGNHDNALDRYDRSVARGHKYLSSKIDGIFDGGKSSDEDFSKQKSAIDDWISKGGVTSEIQQEIYKKDEPPQNFAGGGDVKPNDTGVSVGHPVERAYPDQNIILNTVKGRVSHYLSSLKPQEHQPKLAFDDNPDDSIQKKTYNRALHIAAHPMRLLDKIKNGTIEPEHIKHFNAMYPELSDVLQKKITEKITHAQLKGKKPSYKMRQGLSLLMGTPLSSELSPQNVAAAQATFKSAAAQPQQGSPAPAKKTSALSKSSQAFLTADQAAASRQQKQ